MKRFKKIYIEITNICNLKCEFCPITQRKPELMDITMFNNILSQVKDFTDYIYLHVKGEPFLHPELGSFLDLAESYGLKVNITTNGTLIKKVTHKLLDKNSLRQINFSLHSFDANELDYSMEDYLGDILEFTQVALSSSNIIISYRLWNLEEDIKSVEKNRHILNIIEKSFNLDYRIEDKLLDSRGIKIAKNLYINAASRFQWPDKKFDECDSTGFCYGLRDQVAILADGTVVPCCLDGEGVINLGNVNEKSFSEIINGKRALSIFEGFSNRLIVEELCQKCDYRRRFTK
jgi:radical SAM protein with 4Fe4S-binding SPASM domain